MSRTFAAEVIEDANPYWRVLPVGGDGDITKSELILKGWAPTRIAVGDRVLVRYTAIPGGGGYKIERRLDPPEEG